MDFETSTPNRHQAQQADNTALGQQQVALLLADIENFRSMYSTFVASQNRAQFHFLYARSGEYLSRLEGITTSVVLTEDQLKQLLESKKYLDGLLFELAGELSKKMKERFEKRRRGCRGDRRKAETSEVESGEQTEEEIEAEGDSSFWGGHFGHGRGGHHHRGHHHGHHRGPFFGPWGHRGIGPCGGRPGGPFGDGPFAAGPFGGPFAAGPFSDHHGGRGGGPGHRHPFAGPWGGRLGPLGPM